MKADKNELVVQRWFYEVFNERAAEVAERIVTPEHTF